MEGRGQLFLVRRGEERAELREPRGGVPSQQLDEVARRQARGRSAISASSTGRYSFGMPIVLEALPAQNVNSWDALYLLQ